MNNNDSEFSRLINEVIQKADIVSIINEYVHLEKAGSDYKGLCPFHLERIGKEDKNASLMVSPSKHIYKCYSCGAGGNVIRFIQDFKKVTFTQALREVAETCGIKVQLSGRELQEQKNQKYYDITKSATEFYKFYLNNTADGSEALEYLHKRQLSDDVITRFNIGLSGSSDITLYNALKDKYLPIDMASVGLLNEYNGKYFDSFKNKIIFPIENLDGKVVGFSGRIYKQNDNDSKYKNTNETVIFKKSQILYNYSRALQDIKATKTVYLFEGFMDVIAAYRAGVPNAVASMGTALTMDQINALKRVCETVVICYDGDDPGILATKRAISLIIQNGLNVKCIEMPDEYKDADEYINALGEEALKNHLLNEAISGIDYYYSKAYKELDKNDIVSVEKFKNTIFGYLHIFKSNLVKEIYFKRLSDDLNVSVDALMRDYQTSPDEMVGFNENQAKKSIDKAPKSKYNNSTYPEKYYNAEKELLLIAYKHIDRTPEIYKKLENNFVDENNSCLIQKLYQIHQAELSISTEEEINAKLTNDEKELLIAVMNDLPVTPSVNEIDILCNLVKQNAYQIAYNSLKNKPDKTEEECKEFVRLKQMITVKKERK